MISLPKSGFNARVLLLGADRLRLFHWRGGAVSDSGLFETGARARADFKAYLAARPAEPVYLLVDSAQEEFRQETIPRVFGADRKALIRRKQARLFGHSNRVYARRQGREQGGRRDERLLFMALSGRDVIEPWTQMLLAQKVPLRGILSVPALLQTFIRTLPDLAGHALLVTLHSVSGPRQTFFVNGELKLSRLGQPAPSAAALAAEIEQFQRYLSSLRLLPEDRPLDVYVIADEALHRALAPEQGRLQRARWHHLEIRQLERQRNIRPEQAGPFSDRLLLAHLCRTRPPNCYATAGELRYARLARARFAIHAGGLFLLIFSLIYSGLNFTNGLAYRQAAAELAHESGRYRAAYERAGQRLPETALPPAAIKAAVAAAAGLEQYRATPRQALALLGGALARFPDIRPLAIEWSHGPAADPPEAAPEPGPEAAPRLPYYQSITLNARIEPFAGNYRAAIARVNEFARALRALAPVHAVEIASLPLDLSSAAVLQGDGVAPAGAAPFALKALLGAD